MIVARASVRFRMRLQYTSRPVRASNSPTGSVPGRPAMAESLPDVGPGTPVVRRWNIREPRRSWIAARRLDRGDVDDAAAVDAPEPCGIEARRQLPDRRADQVLPVARHRRGVLAVGPEEADVVDSDELDPLPLSDPQPVQVLGRVGEAADQRFEGLRIRLVPAPAGQPPLQSIHGLLEARPEHGLEEIVHRRTATARRARPAARRACGRPCRSRPPRGTPAAGRESGTRCSVYLRSVTGDCVPRRGRRSG